MDRYINKRVIVTGGAGFLGSHLCEKLLAKNYDVLCIDNFIPVEKPMFIIFWIITFLNYTGTTLHFLCILKVTKYTT